MNRSCSHAQLQSALAGNLPAEDEAALQQHLEECEECGAEMERLAGGATWCQEAAELLQMDQLDAEVPTRDDWSASDFTVEHLEPADDPTVLGRLGGYDVLEIIGQGGMGVVLKGYDRELKRCVAIKVLAPHLAQNSLARKRFAREAQAAAAVVHPQVMAIHQVQPSGRLPFLVMPLVSGESLAQRLTAQGRLELKEILRIGMQAAAGLSAAHEQGLVHRDVKPANILLEKGVERAVLTDFGLARAADDVTLTRWGIIAGTPQYMSPEQARGEPLDGRSDLFSLGCVLYEMATGVSPFRTETMMATLRRLVDDPPQALASLNPELPPWFIAIVDRLLEKDPTKRFSSAKEVSELLEGCLAHLQQPTNVPMPATLPKPALPSPSVSSWRSIRYKGVMAMFATLGLGLFGALMLLAGDPPDIAGSWTGEEWGSVVLKSTIPGEYTGTYTDTFGVKPGELSLKWSRIEGRFNGIWREGEDRFGEISVRLVNNEIRGAHTTDAKSKINPATPRLADLRWSKVVSSPQAKADIDMPAAVEKPSLSLPAKAGSANSVEFHDEVLKLELKQAKAKLSRLEELYKQGNVSEEEYSSLKSRIEILEAQLRGDQTGEAKAILKEARLRFERRTKLYENKMISTDELEDSKIAVDIAESKLRAVNSNASLIWNDVKEAKAVLNESKIRFERATALYKRGMLSISELEERKIAVEIADAKLREAEAKVSNLQSPSEKSNSVMVKSLLSVQKLFHINSLQRVPVIAFSPDGQILALGGEQASIVDAKNGKRIAWIRLLSQEKGVPPGITPQNVSADALAFSPDSKVLAIGSGIGQVKLFDAQTGAYQLSLTHDEKLPHNHVRALAYSPDGTLLATCGDTFDEAKIERTRLGSRDGVLRVWDAKTGKLKLDLKSESVTYVAFTPDGKFLASSGHWSSGSGVRLWDLQTGKVAKELAIPNGNLGGGTPTCFSFSPDGKRLAMGIMQYDKSTDVTSGSINVVFPASGILDLSWRVPRSVWPIVFASDGSNIAALTGPSTLTIWDTWTGQAKTALNADETQEWGYFAFNANNNLLAISGMVAPFKKRGFVEMWNLTGLPSEKAKASPPPAPTVIDPTADIEQKVALQQLEKNLNEIHDARMEGVLLPSRNLPEGENKAKAREIELRLEILERNASELRSIIRRTKGSTTQVIDSIPNIERKVALQQLEKTLTEIHETRTEGALLPSKNLPEAQHKAMERSIVLRLEILERYAAELRSIIRRLPAPAEKSSPLRP